jgi:hypothetical protein
MCDPISATLAVLGAYQVSEQRKAGSQAADAQKVASDTAVANATKQADQADQANNKANAKQPDVMSLNAANMANAKGGVSGTMLTGPQGVDPNSLLLGKTTLLGGK